MDSKETIKKLSKIVGTAHVTDEDFILEAYDQDFATHPPSVPKVVVRPRTTETDIIDEVLI